MSGRIAKSQIPILPVGRLTPIARMALIEAKQMVAARVRLTPFGNTQGAVPGEGSPLPALPNGSLYYEWRVGQAHPGDPRPAGSHRFVLEINEPSHQIREIYYTEEHYAKFSFYRIVF